MAGFRSTILLLAAALILPAAAHADTIDDFTLTGAGNTYTWSLPATPTITTSGIVAFYVTGGEDISINGAPAANYGIEFIGGPSMGRDILVPILGVGLLIGPQFFEPNVYTPTFVTGTYALTTPVFPTTDFTLTITQEPASSVTPEPSSLALLGTGACGLIGLMKRRRA